MGNQTSVVAASQKATFEWEINDCDNFREISSSVGFRSNIFKIIVDNQVTEWQFVLYPKGDTKLNNKYVSLKLEYLSAVDGYADVSCAMVNSENVVIREYNRDKEQIFEGKTLVWDKFIEHAYLFNDTSGLVLSKNKMTIRCKISQDKYKKPERKLAKKRIEDYEEADELCNLLDNKYLSDVTI